MKSDFNPFSGSEKKMLDKSADGQLDDKIPGRMPPSGHLPPN